MPVTAATSPTHVYEIRPRRDQARRPFETIPLPKCRMIRHNSRRAAFSLTVSEKSGIDAEKARVLRRDAEWVLAASEGRDIERILSFCPDDAVVLPPDLPAIIGKAALRQDVESSLRVPGFRITWSTDEAVISPDGQFAYLLGNNAVTMNDPTGEPVTTKGRAVTIWQRGTDGEWRCAVDIWNAEPNC